MKTQPNQPLPPQNRQSSPLSQYFAFKNAETYVEITKILNGYEGVLPGTEQNFLFMAHGQKKGQLYLDAQKWIEKFWVNHPGIVLTDLVGVLNMAILDLQTRTINNANKTVTEMQNALKEAGFDRPN